MRIFSYLRYGGFRPADLGRLTNQLSKLLGLAGHYDITLQLENEPVCNVGNIAELAAFFAADVKASKEEAPDEEEAFEQQDSQPKLRYLRPLVDIANSWSHPRRTAERCRYRRPPAPPRTTAIHLKDRDLAAKRTGRWATATCRGQPSSKRLLGGVEIPRKCWPASRPTARRMGATPRRARWPALRRIAAEIGVEVV